MSRFSINFENEEQYRNFITSIKNEVVKEIESPVVDEKPSWVVFRDELKKDIVNRRELENRRIQDSTVAGYSDYYPFLKEAFDIKRIDQLTLIDEETLRDFKNDLFKLITRYREEYVRWGN